MAIPDYARTNFETLMKAAKAGDLALMECTEVDSGETRYVLCAVGRDDGDYGRCLRKSPCVSTYWPML